MKCDDLQNEVLRLEQVSASYSNGQGRHLVLKDVSLRAYRGEMVLLLGQSGSGKTTLLTIAAGLRSPDVGQVWLFGSKIRQYSSGELQSLRARKLGFVFQDFKLLSALTVRDNIGISLRYAGWGRQQIRERVDQLLSDSGLAGLASRYPHALSHGQRQRVALLRSLANGGPLILADEPTASLDEANGMDIIRSLTRCATTNGSCVLVASHDIRLAGFAHRVCHLQDGLLTERADCAHQDLIGGRIPCSDS